jgi:hypothetical protein
MQEESIMMKNIKMLGWLVMAAVLTSGNSACSSNEYVAEGESLEHADKISMRIMASRSDLASSRALWLDGKSLRGEWKKGDKLKVFIPILSPGTDISELSVEGFEELGELTAQNDGVTSEFIGTLNKLPTPDYPIIAASPRFPFVYTGQKGTLADIAANYDYVSGILENISIGEGNTLTVPNTVGLSNYANQSIFRFTLQDREGNPINATSLTISEANSNILQKYSMTQDDVRGDITITPDAATSEIWASLLFGENLDLTLTATGADGNTYIYSKKGVNLKTTKFYSITVKISKLVDLSKLTTHLTVKDGDVLTGTMAGHGKLSIEDSAKITLRDVTINGIDNEAYKWAGLTCEGDAEITLEGDNTVTGFHRCYPGILVSEGHTLTIKGDGSLAASPSHGLLGNAPGIGGLGSYVLQSEYSIKGGNINIIGGTIDALGGENCPGIGGGPNGVEHGWVKIDSTVTKVTSTRGAKTLDNNNAVVSVGFGAVGWCEKITVGNTVYWENSEFKNGGETSLGKNPFVYEPEP